MKALKLIEIGFDWMENHNAEYQKELGIFLDNDPSNNAFCKCGKFLLSMSPPKFFLGWNGQVYPQFKVKEIEVE